MNKEQLVRMETGQGFIAALDQSGGSTPKALSNYGVIEDSYTNEEEMFTLVHQMRSRIMESPAFTSEHILGAILFEGTMEKDVAGKATADYLWEDKGILSFLKIDKGLAELVDGVQLLKPIPNLTELLAKAKEHHIFGTKERSLIKLANHSGIQAVVDQQFELGKKVFAAGLIPIIEPEVDITSPEKVAAEELLLAELTKQLNQLAPEVKVMLKLTIPTKDNLYDSLVNHPQVLRVVALSGGYSRFEANKRLGRNDGVIASFSRALSEGLNVSQSRSDFNQTLGTSIKEIYEASIK